MSLILPGLFLGNKHAARSEELLNVGMDDVNQVINGLENNNAFNNGLDIPSFPGF